MNNEKRLYIVTVRLEFQYPVLADSVAAASSGSTIRAAVEDLSVVPWKSTVDRAWPDYKAPEGYEQRSLVYQATPPRGDVTWAEAVKADRLYSERDLCFACTEELAFGPVGWTACKGDRVTGVDAEVSAAVTAGDFDGIELGGAATTDAAKGAT
jgi:hypothetical protein